MIFSAILLALVVGTWNGNWFPSGRAEHRAHPDVEDATITAAAKMFAEGLLKADPDGTNDVILVINEVRGPVVLSNLVSRIGRKGLRIASISAYRRRDRFDQQQDAILTTLPVSDSGWSVWKNRKIETPPRGYAFASIVIEPSVTARVYAVHLKSNYGATDDEIRELNRTKRKHAIGQIVAQEKKSGFVLIVGDFNADPWRKEFADEPIFPILFDAGYVSVLETLTPKARGTYPHRRYGDSALDHIYYKGFWVERTFLLPNDALSDHFAVFSSLTTQRTTKQ